MILQDLDINKVSRLISQQIDHVTCIECCKYFTVPTTALCGHTLCHTCWRGRHTCPSCGTESVKKSLKLNIPLQDLTKHVNKLHETFEELFKIKLDEFLLEAPGVELPQDPNKNVKEWLTSSQNHFSVPPTNSILSTQESTPYVERVTSHVEVHSENKKKPIPMEVEYAPQQQHDWDKIEVVADTENIPQNDKENVVGPMDIETFDFIVDDKEYSTEKPRRSIRNKENKNLSNNSINEIASNVKCFSNNSMDTNKNSLKSQLKSWNNVKKMKKEFSKLNKQNKNKLNVSIEMCKKTQTSANKIVESHISTQAAIYSIDDNTPEIAVDKKKDCGLEASVNNITTVETTTYCTDNHISRNPLIVDVNCIKKPIEKNMNSSENTKKEEKSNEIKVPFLKKSSLLVTNDNNNISKDLNGKENSSSVNMDDIEITIKIGNTLTNIHIKKKDNDVQLHVKTDREIQTSLKDVNDQVNKCHVQTQENSLKEQNINVDVVSIKNKHPTQNTIIKVDENRFEKRSDTTKKNTASAETVPAPEITESMERELFQTMGNLNSERKLVKESNGLTSQALNEIEENVADLNDLDIFDSESVKEGNIQSLKDIRGTPSAILMPTCRSNVAKDRNPEKRNREESDNNDTPITKKIKVVNENNKLVAIEENSIAEDLQKNNTMECSELDNYNEIISQVFANIDADIIHMQKTKQKNETQKEIQQCDQNADSERIKKNDTVNVSQKCSENVFSILEKDSEEYETIGKKKHIPDESQNIKTNVNGKIENTQTQTSRKLSQQNDSEIIVQSTPVQDDALSDHSIVEETPQKSTSFAKVKSKGDTANSGSKLSNHKVNSLGRHSQPKEQDSNVITLSDTLVDNSKIGTADKAKPRATLETPFSINKFVDHIKYKSTPMAKKSLNFNSESIEENEHTLCETLVAAKTTQEREFMSKAFEQSCSPSQTQPAFQHSKKVSHKNVTYCIAGSCLSSQQQANLKKLCAQKNWTFADKYTKDLTHLVVGVDDENKSQRSVKFMCALAASKWIISYEWVAKCLQSTEVANEEPFEALDGTGEPGPRRSRITKRKLFQGITFYCMPPFSVLDSDTLKEMLESAGGCVVTEMKAARAGTTPALLLAEPEQTQEDRFIYLAMEYSIVPVNYEWALNCLGSYSLSSIYELLLCPASLLPKVTDKWPPELISRDYE